MTGNGKVILPGEAPQMLEEVDSRSIRGDVAGFVLRQASDPGGRDGRRDRDWTRLDADGGQCAAWLMGERTQGTGDSGEAEHTSEGDGEVT